MHLEVHNLHTFYGSSQALFGVSLKVREGEAVCLLGRNGVGKTTTLRSVMGISRPRAGSIKFKGEEIVGKFPFQIARLGIGYVPDTSQVFSELTVRENLEVAYRKMKKDSEEWTIDKIYALFPRLNQRQKQRGQFLSGGEQRMLAIGRALMTNPDLLLLDEPSEGLAPLVRREIIGQIGELRNGGRSILLAEQNLALSLLVSQGVYIIEDGRICWEGTAEEISKNEEVIKKHLAV